jgi:hypothetical protein
MVPNPRILTSGPKILNFRTEGGAEEKGTKKHRTPPNWHFLALMQIPGIDHFASPDFCRFPGVLCQVVVFEPCKFPFWVVISANLVPISKKLTRPSGSLALCGCVTSTRAGPDWAMLGLMQHKYNNKAYPYLLVGVHHQEKSK